MSIITIENYQHLKDWIECHKKLYCETCKEKTWHKDTYKWWICEQCCERGEIK